MDIRDFSNDVISDANTLRNNNVQKRQIKEISAEILRKINDEINIAHRDGKHYIITDIPIIFDISNMTNKDAQRRVWSNIIEILETKNYRVWINANQNSCKLKITWLSADEESMIKSQTSLLAKRTQQF